MATYIERENTSGPLAIILMIVVLAAAAFGVYYFMDRDATPDTNTTIIENPATPAESSSTDINFQTPDVETPAASDSAASNNNM